MLKDFQLLKQSYFKDEMIAMFLQNNVNNSFISKVPSEMDWSFVVIYDPR